MEVGVESMKVYFFVTLEKSFLYLNCGRSQVSHMNHFLLMGASDQKISYASFWKAMKNECCCAVTKTWWFFTVSPSVVNKNNRTPFDLSCRYEAEQPRSPEHFPFSLKWDTAWIEMAYVSSHVMATGHTVYVTHMIERWSNAPKTGRSEEWNTHCLSVV